MRNNKVIECAVKMLKSKSKIHHQDNNIQYHPQTNYHVCLKFPFRKIKSPHGKEAKTVLDSGFHDGNFGFQLLESSFLVRGTWIPDSLSSSVFRIPKPRFPESTENFPDSSFHKQEFPGSGVLYTGRVKITLKSEIIFCEFCLYHFCSDVGLRQLLNVFLISEQKGAYLRSTQLYSLYQEVRVHLKHFWLHLILFQSTVQLLS